MTIRKRLFFSNLFMILVPVFATALIGLVCVGFIWLVLINGAGLGLKNPEDFGRACMAITEVVEKQLEKGYAPSSLESLLDSNGMRIAITRDGAPFYSYGQEQGGDERLLSAADFLGNDASITQKGRSLYVRRESVDDQSYVICLFGGGTGTGGYGRIKAALVGSVLVIAAAVLLSIWLTNRFLTRFVFRRIQEPLEILANGVHELRDGNLDYRIAYDRQDEFWSVCADYNEMAGRLKALVTRLQQQEHSRRELIAGISHDIRSL